MSRILVAVVKKWWHHVIIGIQHDCVCIVGVKLPRVLSRRGAITRAAPSWSPGTARQHPREFDTNNTHTIMLDPLKKNITWTNVDKVIWHHMVSLGQNESIKVLICVLVLLWSPLACIYHLRLEDKRYSPKALTALIKHFVEEYIVHTHTHTPTANVGCYYSPAIFRNTTLSMLWWHHMNAGTHNRGTPQYNWGLWQLSTA